MEPRVFEVGRPHIPELEALWTSCLSRARPNCHFFTYGWFKAWLDTYGTRPPWTGRGQVIVATAADGEAVGILPLGIAGRRGVKIVSLGGYIQPIRTPIIAREALGPACTTLAGALARRQVKWHILRLSPVEMSSPEMRAVVDSLRSACLSVDIRPLPRTISTSKLPASFEEYKGRILGTKFAKDIAYFERRLRRERMNIRHYCNPSEEDLQTLLTDCRAVEGRSWLSKSQNAHWRFATDSDFRFWKHFVARGLPPDGRFDAWIMDLDSRPISFCVTLSSGKTMNVIANQYDMDHHKYSSGSVLYHHAIEHAYQQGIEVIDFGEGDVHYKQRWGGNLGGERSEIVAFPKGMLGVTLSTLNNVAKRLQAINQPRQPSPLAQEHGKPPAPIPQDSRQTMAGRDGPVASSLDDAEGTSPDATTVPSRPA